MHVYVIVVRCSFVTFVYVQHHTGIQYIVHHTQPSRTCTLFHNHYIPLYLQLLLRFQRIPNVLVTVELPSFTDEVDKTLGTEICSYVAVASV